LKNAADSSEIMQVMEGKAVKEDIIHQALTANPQFAIITGGGVTPRNSQGIPWCASYINSNGDLTVDLRTNLASESRAKLVYEHLMKFTDDPYIHETLSFLMTREVTHYKMFEAALNSIPDNFPPGVLAADPRFLQSTYNMSAGTVRGPWNEGEMTGLRKSFVYVSDPIAQVKETVGQTQLPEDFTKDLKDAEKLNKENSKKKSEEVKKAEPDGVAQWSTYADPKN